MHPKLWKRLVDDTFIVINKTHKEAFLEHLNSVNSDIQLTSEEPCEDGSIPFLDMLITPDEEGRLKTTVYRKPTHKTSICIGTAIMPYHQNIV